MNDRKQYTFLGTVIVIMVILGAYAYLQFIAVPSAFPVNKNFIVNENESLKSISERLQKEGFITSPLLFRAGISFFGKDRGVQLGGYSFPTPLSLFGVIQTFVSGRPTSPLLSVTIPEGSTADEVAQILSKAVPTLSQTTLLQLISANHINGQLFPSTYFLLPSYNEIDILKVMVTTFTKKTEEILLPSQVAPPLTGIRDVVILASILEGEAKTEADMKIVAGILLNRLSKGMPLQVDVAKETYTKKGLPVDPINNPGLIALKAVLSPTFTDYLYYITGRDGAMYYAKTFDEHKKNIRAYLK